MVVVVAGGDEGHRQAHLPTVAGEVEAEAVAVEGERAVEVGDVEVDVADADRRVDWVAGGHGSSVPGSRGRGIGVFTYS